jgi:endoribonuclease Dicer
MAHLAVRQAKALRGFLGDIPPPTKHTINAAATSRPLSNKVPGNQENTEPSNSSLAPVPHAKDDVVVDEEPGYESEDEGVKRWLIDAPHKPRKITEKKRADAAAFAAWLETNQKQISDYDNKPVGDQEKSLTRLVKDFESHKIIASPRDYQIELFEKAKMQNSIAVLDTGTLGLILPLVVWC